MQEFLYYGGLENANHYAPFAKDGIQSGNGFFPLEIPQHPIGALWGRPREVSKPIPEPQREFKFKMPPSMMQPDMNKRYRDIESRLKLAAANAPRAPPQNGSGFTLAHGATPEMYLDAFKNRGKMPFKLPSTGFLGLGKKKKKQKGGRVMKSHPVMKRMPMPTPALKAVAKAAPVKEIPKSMWQRAKAFIKDNKIVSRGLSELSNLADKTEMFKKYVPYLSGASTASGLAGWGKRKRRGKKARK